MGINLRPISHASSLLSMLCLALKWGGGKHAGNLTGQCWVMEICYEFTHKHIFHFIGTKIPSDFMLGFRLDFYA